MVSLSVLGVYWPHLPCTLRRPRRTTCPTSHWPTHGGPQHWGCRGGQISRHIRTYVGTVPPHEGPPGHTALSRVGEHDNQCKTCSASTTHVHMYVCMYVHVPHVGAFHCG